MIVADIQEKIKNGAKPNDICVLFRTNTGGRAIYERLHQSAIPYETRGWCQSLLQQTNCSSSSRLSLF
ncbi:hypothetical protein ACEQPO_09565 [Bacillus sp. SL00103]